MGGSAAAPHIRAVAISINPTFLNLLNIGWDDTIIVRCEVNPNEPHEKAYTTSAQEFDAARRLAITCTSAAGKKTYVRAGGENAAQRANGLVDELEGVPPGRKREKGKAVL